MYTAKVFVFLKIACGIISAGGSCGVNVSKKNIGYGGRRNLCGNSYCF